MITNQKFCLLKIHPLHVFFGILPIFASNNIPSQFIKIIWVSKKLCYPPFSVPISKYIFQSVRNDTHAVYDYINNFFLRILLYSFKSMHNHIEHGRMSPKIKRYIITKISIASKWYRMAMAVFDKLLMPNIYIIWIVIWMCPTAKPVSQNMFNILPMYYSKNIDRIWNCHSEANI